MDKHYVIWFSYESSSDIKQLGGKNASLGEMTRRMTQDEIAVPDGFAVTADAYWEFIDHNRLREPLSEALGDINNKRSSLAGGRQAHTRAGESRTVSAAAGRSAEGDTGYVYDGIAEFDVRDLALEDIGSTRTKVMLNMANPAAAMRWWRLPADGVGLARMEFIVSNIIQVHPDGAG